MRRSTRESTCSQFTTLDDCVSMLFTCLMVRQQAINGASPRSAQSLRGGSIQQQDPISIASVVMSRWSESVFSLVHDSASRGFRISAVRWIKPFGAGRRLHRSHIDRDAARRWHIRHGHLPVGSFRRSAELTLADASLESTIRPKSGNYELMGFIGNKVLPWQGGKKSFPNPELRDADCVEVRFPCGIKSPEIKIPVPHALAATEHGPVFLASEDRRRSTIMGLSNTLVLVMRLQQKGGHDRLLVVAVLYLHIRG